MRLHFVGSVTYRLISQTGQPIPDFRPSDQFRDFALKQADVLLWRSRRDENGRPDVRREVGIAGLRDVGHARQCLGPGIARQRERSQLVLPDMLDSGR